MPRLISHHTSHRQSRRPPGRRGLNRPARARPVADAALYCAQQGSLTSRLLRPAGLWWHPYSHGTLLVTMLVCFGMPNTDWRQCDVRASAEGVRWHAALGRAHTRLPLSSAAWARCCISRNRPRAVANRRRRGGRAADLSSCTRRDLSRRWPGPSRSRRVRVRAGHVRQ